MANEEILQSPRFQMEATLIRRCSEEPEFRAKVLADPKGMLEEALGQKLPEQLKVFVHEEDLQNLHFSVPPTRESLQKELTDEQLEQVAGGTDIVTLTVLSLTAAFVLGTVVSVGATAGGGVAAYETAKRGGW